MTRCTFKTGSSRDQGCLLPSRVEDYVGPDNPVRAIEIFVDALDLEAKGFRHAGREVGVGQPPYDPADLLKLYLYGYLNRVRSSRLLERETGRNLEVMWLLRGLQPGYRTIAKFRRENWSALKQANQDFVLVARGLDLVGGTLIAVDGAFFHGDASKASIKTRKKLKKELAALVASIEAYRADLDAADAAEAEPVAGGEGGGGEGGGRKSGEGLRERVAALMAERAKAEADLKRLEESGESQLSRTDGDARLLSKSGQKVSGYNVQIAVDEKHKLIVESEVVNDGNDTGQLDRMAEAAKETLGVETLQVVADGGYYNGAALKRCEEAGIVAYVPESERSGRLAAQGRFPHRDFTYEAGIDAYRCPAGQLLRPTKTPKKNGDRIEIRYVSRKPVCDACPLRERCVTPKQPTREILRWEHEDVIERHRERMKGADGMMRRRAALVEHPFGTLKCRAGYRHFLVRGFDKVRGEWGLMALCYNFSRVLRILGFDRFKALIARAVTQALLRPHAAQSALLRAEALLRALATAIGAMPTQMRHHPRPEGLQHP